MQTLDQKYPLTQKLCAEIFAGVTTNKKIMNPIAYSIEKGFVRPAPDGKFYETDTIEIGNFILMLDSFLPPKNPDRFFPLKNIKSDSYLYIPYMRLVEYGIVNLDENINPEMHTLLSQGVRAICTLKNRGLIK
ncbi:MAG: hypothetical protein ABIL20_08755 [candidate division WOR-3 bacterium]